jgi:uncharacterized protein (DUF488 family)
MTPSAPLCTIGYQGSSFDAVRTTLIEAGVTLLIDVRAVASSRRPGFSKRLLAGGLAEAGIGYLHLQPLGTPKPGRDAVRRGDIETMRQIFLAHMQGDRSQIALAEAASAATVNRACLLCFERDPAHCHRTLVAGLIGALTAQQVLHLQARPYQESPHGSK